VRARSLEHRHREERGATVTMGQPLRPRPPRVTLTCQFVPTSPIPRPTNPNHRSRIAFPTASGPTTTRAAPMGPSALTTRGETHQCRGTTLRECIGIVADPLRAGNAGETPPGDHGR
jgi:hypothetical protein